MEIAYIVYGIIFRRGNMDLQGTHGAVHEHIAVVNIIAEIPRRIIIPGAVHKGSIVPLALGRDGRVVPPCLGQIGGSINPTGQEYGSTGLHVFRPLGKGIGIGEIQPDPCHNAEGDRGNARQRSAGTDRGGNA